MHVGGLRFQAVPGAGLAARMLLQRLGWDCRPSAKGSPALQSRTACARCETIEDPAAPLWMNTSSSADSG